MNQLIQDLNKLSTSEHSLEEVLAMAGIVPEKKHYIYFVEDERGAGFGPYETKEEAEKDMREGSKVVAYEAKQCRCGRWEKKELMDRFGECIVCDGERAERY
jgi:hypothetical protein